MVLKRKKMDLKYMYLKGRKLDLKYMYLKRKKMDLKRKKRKNELDSRKKRKNELDSRIQLKRMDTVNNELYEGFQGGNPIEWWDYVIDEFKKMFWNWNWVNLMPDGPYKSILDYGDEDVGFEQDRCVDAIGYWYCCIHRYNDHVKSHRTVIELEEEMNKVFGICWRLELDLPNRVADIKGKTSEEIHKTINIDNDFTPEEEEEVRREKK
ncbi:Uncharacterized protein TCM_025692 [Theobroma cacao]|uniref:SKP1 component dimerisation domain-containing protein n=1 Tax=Theobroma cacao TaxID=3641 RepID=A0A061EZU4_THECC|nr:Uncharacterized protein TCM_025692 [Theobroma cacao]